MRGTPVVRVGWGQQLRLSRAPCSVSGSSGGQTCPPGFCVITGHERQVTPTLHTSFSASCPPPPPNAVSVLVHICEGKTHYLISRAAGNLGVPPGSRGGRLCKVARNTLLETSSWYISLLLKVNLKKKQKTSKQGYSQKPKLAETTYHFIIYVLFLEYKIVLGMGEVGL